MSTQIIERPETNSNKKTRSYFIFRIAQDEGAHKWLMSELLEKGILRQGWGKMNMSLVNENGSWVDPESWGKEYSSIWNHDDDKTIKTRYGILSRMRNISEGDVIIIPKTQNGRTFTLCEASESYSFDDTENTHWNDFRHCIKIRNPRNFHYSSSVEAKLISSKFKAYQAAVNNVKHSNTIETIDELYLEKPSNDEINIKQIIDGLTQIAIKPIANRFLDIDPNTFENIIAECLKNRGYEIIAMRQYDGKGTDFDIIASFPLPYFSELTDQAPTLLIQIKKKRGNDRDDIAGVKQLVNHGKDHLFPIKILMNTSDSISSEAAELAETNRIKIINGLGIIDFILKS